MSLNNMIEADDSSESLKSLITKTAISLGGKFPGASDTNQRAISTALSLLILAEQTDKEKEARRLFNTAKSISRGIT